MYEDYMQNLFGYNYCPYTYEPNQRDTDNYGDQFGYSPNTSYNYMGDLNYFNNSYSFAPPMQTTNNTVNLENLYPEIYNIVYPMIKKMCKQNFKPLSEELIEEMTQDIYNNIESDNILNLNINIENSPENNSTLQSRNSKNMSNRVETIKATDTEPENRQFNNSLRDLIKILLIRELIGNSNRPPRPRPSMPPRPPFRPR